MTRARHSGFPGAVRDDATMSVVAFRLEMPVAVQHGDLWTALVDWASHGDWIPATRSHIVSGDGGLGTEFVAVSGFGKLALVDRMRVIAFDAANGAAEVEKLGPVLRGTAGFTITDRPGGCMLEWHESVVVPLLPGFLEPLAAALGKALFRLALQRLLRRMR